MHASESDMLIPSLRLARVALLALAVAAPAAFCQNKAPTTPPPAAPPAPAAAPTPVPPAATDTLKRIRDTGVLLVGVREASVPFSFLDAQKQPQGYSVDLCMRIADAIKNEL